MTAGPPHHFPPPGAPPPEDPSPGIGGGPSYDAAPAPDHRPPTYATYQQARAGVPAWQLMAGAAHKPGAVPLRPLTLGAMYDGAFRIIRYNPKATVGAAVLVTAVAMLVPVVVTFLVTFVGGVTVDITSESSSDELSTSEAVGLLAAYGSLIFSSVLSWIGLTMVTAMVAHVVHAAAIGRKLDLDQAWAATRGKRWRVLGLALLVTLALLAIWTVWVLLLALVIVGTSSVLASVLWGIASFVGCVALMFWTWIKLFYLPVAALVLEPVGVLGAIGRGWRLTHGQFWRTFGIALLTYLMGTFAGGILSVPVSFVFQILALAFPEQSLLLVFVGQAIATVLQNAFVAPFLAAVTTLQYLDLRMRKEAYDVELMREAGLLPR
jgi:hypothetical protein